MNFWIFILLLLTKPWFLTFMGLLVITLIGIVLIEVSIRSFKSKNDLLIHNRLAWWGWRVAGVGVAGISIHVACFIYVNDIPTPLLPEPEKKSVRKP